MNQGQKNTQRKNFTSSAWVVSCLALSPALFLAACKPKSPEDASTSAAALEKANTEMAQRMNQALDQLSTELDLLEATEPTAVLPNQYSAVLGFAAPIGLKSVVSRVNALWKNVQGNPCRVWSPIVRSVGRGLARPYFFVGASAEAGAGVHGMIGRDYVWDFYNLQISVFNYKALELVFGSGTVGAGVNLYAGLGFGNKRDVNDAWSGKFATTGLSGSLPILSDYLSGHVAYFSAQTPQGQADFRFKGGSMGLSAGVSAPTTLPGALQVASGNWIVDKVENQKLSRRLTQFGIKNSMQGSDTCQGNCVRIDNIKAGMGYTGRAVNLARSIPLLSAGGSGLSYFPGIEKFMLLAIATGAYRDTLNTHEACR
jgi:hypothetical protein